MSLIFMMIVLENQLKMSWKVLEFEKKILVGTMPHNYAEFPGTYILNSIPPLFSKAGQKDC